MSSASSTLDDVALPWQVPGTPGTFICKVEPGWSLFAGKGCFGGVLKAQLSRASALLMPPSRRLRSMNTTFLAPASVGEVTVTARVLREGKAMSHVAVEAHQEGQLLTVAHCAFGASRPGSHTEPSLAMPSGLPPPGHEPFAELKFAPTFFREQMEAQWVERDGVRLLAGAAEPSIRLWLRFRESPRPTGGLPARKDCGLLVALLDAPPPPIWTALSRPAVVASVSTHMQLVRDPEELSGEHPWFYYESRLTHAGDGMSDIQGRLWHEDGTLCGLITQHLADLSSTPTSRL